MKLGPFQEVILESSSVEELKEKVLHVCHLHAPPPLKTFNLQNNSSFLDAMYITFLISNYL